MYATDEESACKAMQFSKLGENTSSVLFSGLQRHYYSLAAARMKEFGLTIEDTQNAYVYNHCKMFYLPAHSAKLLLTAPSTAPGVTIAPLTLADAKLVNEHYTFKADWTLKMIEELITTRRTACLRIDGEPVTWGLEQSFGAIGMAYTLPGFRERGYGRDTTRYIAASIVQAGRVPFLFTADVNVASQAMVTSSGFEEVGFYDW
eukprot:NODE_8114_length_723_cov_1.823333_g7862_i0.p1 GENE.NODE_8114_length_723_cov_1.823333_g7862_i0~~NODE_8114_length_723_cov_1.823333_g7862_i0.p1  ORF type:complete len:204 (-),score=19.06 NODE_8114_length_723_cov_1.823333_g7862_i0:112-723(-)